MVLERCGKNLPPIFEREECGQIAIAPDLVVDDGTEGAFFFDQLIIREHEVGRSDLCF